MDFDAVAAELYGAEPEQFVKLRKQRATEARTGGDRELGRRIAALRKPTRSAWIVNLLSGQAATELDELLDLGAALAEAQQRLSAAELRQLSGQRHAAIAALVGRAAQLAQMHGHSPSDTTLREVADSLQAALSDPSVAEVVRQGRLTEAQAYGGFGPAFGTIAPNATVLRSGEKTGQSARSAHTKSPDETEEKASDPEDQAGADDTVHAADTDRAQADAERDRLIDRLNSAQQALDRIRDQQRRNHEQQQKAQSLAGQRAERVDQLRDQLDRAEREARSATEDVQRLTDQADAIRKAERSAEDAVADALSKLAGD